MQHFLASIKHAEGSEDPSPAPFLYLAQLSDPAESLLHFQSALQLLQAKLASLQAARQAQSAGDGADMDMDEDDEDESEIRRSASRALVGMTELYLTDFWCATAVWPRALRCLHAPTASKRAQRRPARRT